MSDLFIFGFSSASKPKIDLSSAAITLGASLTYNGSEQTKTVASVTVNGNTLTAGTDYAITDNTAINAGNYTLSIIGMGSYSGVTTAVWSIAKATGSVSLSPSTLSLDTSNLTGDISVTRLGDGAVTAQSSDTSIATVSVSGTTVTVEAVGSGSATVTVSVGAGTNHEAASATASVEVALVDSTLANNSPETIQAVAQAGTGSQYWSVGDKTAPISIAAFSRIAATTNISAFIIGFNHNSSIEGTGIHFQFGKLADGKDICFYSLDMNNSITNSGGWSNSYMRNTYCPAFLTALPSEWQAVIADCNKYSDNTGGGSDIASYVTKTTDKIFLLAEFEVFGSKSYANSNEKNYQQRYAYYANGNSVIKYEHNDTGSTCNWWLRSVRASSSQFFCDVAYSGNMSAYYANSNLGFAPAFMVG